MPVKRGRLYPCYDKPREMDLSTMAPKTARDRGKSGDAEKGEAGAKPVKAGASAETRIQSIQKRFSKSLAHLAK